MSMPQKKIVVQVKEPDPLVDPIVASFPGGLPHESPEFAWRKIREKAKRGRSLVGKDSTCIYHARNEGRGYDGRHTKLCVGVYNKSTGKLTLHQAAEKGTVFCLSQSVQSYSPEEQERMSAMDRRNALFESFGSSKKQKVLKSQAANVVNVDSVVGAGSAMMGAFLQGQKMSESNREALEQAKTGTKTDAVELAYAEARRKVLPTFDVDAKEPHLVYDARDIAGEEVWAHVTRVTDKCLGQANLTEALTSRGYWLDSVRAIIKQVIPESPSAKYQVKCILLLNYLVSFYKTVITRKRLRGSAEEVQRFLRLPASVGARFLELFCTPLVDQEGYACSKQGKDKCLVHLLLLHLMANGRRMKADNIKPLVKECKIEMSEASNLLREAGCTVKTTTKGTTVSLSVPLTFPQPKRGGRGKAP